jgi:hypothetical protein
MFAEQACDSLRKRQSDTTWEKWILKGWVRCVEDERVLRVTRLTLIAGGLSLGVQACSRHTRARSREMLPDPDILREYAYKGDGSSSSSTENQSVADRSGSDVDTSAAAKCASETDDCDMKRGAARERRRAAAEQQGQHLRWLAHLVHECRQQEQMLDVNLGQHMVHVARLIQEHVGGQGARQMQGTPLKVGLLYMSVCRNVWTVTYKHARLAAGGSACRK